MIIRKIDAAGGVPFRKKKDETQVLLIFRRGVWDLPKGKKEEDETFEACAVREVMEETGISRPERVRYLTDTYHEYEQKNRQYGKTTKWYAMALSSDQNQGLKPQIEEDIVEVKWFALREAKKKVGFENLTSVLDKFSEMVTSTKKTRKE